MKLCGQISVELNVGEDRIIVIRSIHGDRVRKPYRLDARDRRDFLNDVLIDAHHLLRFSRLCLRNGNAQRENFSGLPETGLHVPQRLQCTDHETRADQKD